MLLEKRVENWLVHFQKYFFTYSDGFFNLSYLMNSPNVMINSMEKMPFVKYDKKQQKLLVNNPFCDCIIYHQDIDQGLVLVLSDIKFKANIKSTHIYDKYLPVEHYALVLHIDNNPLPNSNAITAGLNYTNNFWTLIKPGSLDSDYHLKNSHGSYVALHFTQKWIENNIMSPKKRVHLESFIQSGNSYNLWTDDSKELETFYNTFLEIISVKETGNAVDFLRLRLQSYQFLDTFFSNVLSRNESKITTGKEIQKMLLVEKLLLEDMTNFIGIEALANKVGISSTTLKTNFKKAFGKSVYKFYSEKQLILAAEYFKNSNYKIKDIASMFGYENPSKFSKAYKDYFGFLPSKT